MFANRTHAFAGGDVSSGAVRALARAREEQPEGFEADEERLVRMAAERPAREFHQLLRRWSKSVDARRAADVAERLRERRRLRVVPLPTGWSVSTANWIPNPAAR